MKESTASYIILSIIGASIILLGITVFFKEQDKKTVTEYYDIKKSVIKEDIDHIILNETKFCLTAYINLNFYFRNQLNVTTKKIQSNEELVIAECLNERMNYNLIHDASRYDFLDKKFKENNIKFNLSDTSIDLKDIFGY